MASGVHTLPATPGIAAASVGPGRGLVVSTDYHFRSDPCGALEGPADHGLNDEDSGTLKAPSAANFLGGTSFARSCVQRVGKTPTASDPGNGKAHNNPFPHSFSGFSIVAVQFTYVPNDLSKGRSWLAGMKSKRAANSPSAAFDRAQALNRSGKVAEGTESCS